MRCPSLNELPAAPVGKTGWPWTEESKPLAAAPSPAGAWPRITIITPSYNQGEFLEETIRSVLLQAYPELEYIVIDGGSRDASLEIIQKYEQWLSHWLSEPDRGQAHAINKGLSRATGSILGWINSDDLLLPDSLALVGQAHYLSPRDLVAGDVVEFWESSGQTQVVKQVEVELRKFIEFWTRKGSWHQPGIFFPKYLVNTVGFLDESLRYLFDYDFFCRSLAITGAQYLQRLVAAFRYHPKSKTVDEGDMFLFELYEVSRRYWHTIPNVDVAGYKRHASGILFCTGFRRLVRGRKGSFRFIAEGFKTQPFCAILAALRLLPSWPKRRWREMSGSTRMRSKNKPK
jgi:glycosyltransferase involved in cell wall biosynthesis